MNKQTATPVAAQSVQDVRDRLGALALYLPVPVGVVTWLLGVFIINPARFGLDKDTTTLIASAFTVGVAVGLLAAMWAARAVARDLGKQ